MTCTLNARNLQAFSDRAFNQVAGKLPGPVEARFVGVVPGLGQARSISKVCLIPPSPTLVRTLCEWMEPITLARFPRPPQDLTAEPAHSG